MNSLFQNDSSLSRSFQIKQSDFGLFYLMNGIAYDIHFPLQWAITPKKISLVNEENNLSEDFYCGPSHCLDCLHSGSLNGVFIGYCEGCAKEYDFERGNGVIRRENKIINELEYELEDGEILEGKKENSIWNTYLKNIKMEEIGGVYPLCDDDEHLYHQIQFEWNEELDNLKYLLNLRKLSLNKDYEEETNWKEFQEENNYDYNKNNNNKIDEYYYGNGRPLTLEDLAFDSE